MKIKKKDIITASVIAVLVALIVGGCIFLASRRENTIPEKAINLYRPRWENTIIYDHMGIHVINPEIPDISPLSADLSEFGIEASASDAFRAGNIDGINLYLSRSYYVGLTESGALFFRYNLITSQVSKIEFTSGFDWVSYYNFYAHGGYLYYFAWNKENGLSMSFEPGYLCRVPVSGGKEEVLAEYTSGSDHIVCVVGNTVITASGNNISSYDISKNKITEMLEIFGNPSSLHSVGLTAEKEITLARESVARSLSAREDEVFFTSSGTEADNIAILGGAKKNMKVGRRIITTDSEHPAVANPISFLESEGYEVVRLSTKGGRIDMSELDEALTSPVALVSVMRVNNETGAVYDIREISRRVKARSPRAIVHSDCVQAYMKERLSLSSLGADLISVSAHKVHAPKGVGALIVKKGLVLPPHTFGGGQERGLRSGTENTIGIAAFGAARSEEHTSELQSR